MAVEARIKLMWNIFSNIGDPILSLSAESLYPPKPRGQGKDVLHHRWSPTLMRNINKSSFEAHTLDEIPLMGLPLWVSPLQKKTLKPQAGNRSNSILNWTNSIWLWCPQQEDPSRFRSITINTEPNLVDEIALPRLYPIPSNSIKI